MYGENASGTFFPPKLHFFLSRVITNKEESVGSSIVSFQDGNSEVYLFNNTFLFYIKYEIQAAFEGFVACVKKADIACKNFTLLTSNSVSEHCVKEFCPETLRLAASAGLQGVEDCYAVCVVAANSVPKFFFFISCTCGAGRHGGGSFLMVSLCPLVAQAFDMMRKSQ